MALIMALLDMGAIRTWLERALLEEVWLGEIWLVDVPSRVWLMDTTWFLLHMLPEKLLKGI
jgi:hypothetical protein